MNPNKPQISKPAKPDPAGVPTKESNYSSHKLYEGIKPPEFNVSFTSSGKGGGGMRSIGETFEVNPANGTMSMNVPISTTPGRSGFGPSVNLSYSSGGGNGPFGTGWNLSIPHISRKVSKNIPLYDDSDIFVIDGAEDLVPVASNGALMETESDGYTIRRYRPRIENNIVRIERWTRIDSRDDVHWRTISGDNVTMIFGRDTESRVFVGERAPGIIFSWLACESYDGWGNAMVYTYKAEDESNIDIPTLLHEQNREREIRTRARYLKSIKYGNRTPNRKVDDQGNYSVVSSKDMQWLFQLVLDYGEHNDSNPTTQEENLWPMRLDAFSGYRSGFEIRQYRLCKRFLMFHHMKEELGRDDCLVSSTRLNYDENAAFSVLTSIQKEGHVSQKGTSSYITQTLPPIEFAYSKLSSLDELRVEALTTSIPNHSEQGQDIQKIDWVDLYGEGSPGLLLQFKDAAWTYQRNFTALEMKNEKGERILGPTETIDKNPSVRPSSFVDLDRNGNMDAVYLDPQSQMSGYFELQPTGWTNYSSFSSMPTIDTRDGSTKLVDLTGDGLQDIMRIDASKSIVSWYSSLGKEGYSEKRNRLQQHAAPQLYSDDKNIAIYMTDMSGDGLTDVVHILDGKVSYWPNLGYGIFGAEIVMSNSPTLGNGSAHFSLQDRIRLIDIDGSGTSDILYLPSEGGAIAYYNLSGNSWSDGYPIKECPNLDAGFSIFTLDLLGSGTGCLCWADPLKDLATIHYIDLSNGRKPHLLTTYKNNIGEEAVVNYKPSTFYFASDEVSNRPWITKVPFPVQCVSDVLRSDKIARTSTQSRYFYHDGYYDPRDLEFRGFGMVEQWDAEEFDTRTGKLFQRPPVHSKLWFHTGSSAYKVAGRFGPESLQPTQIPDGLNAIDILDAHRALKGLQVLTELYSDDDSDKALLPYTINELRYNIQLVQVSGDFGPAVFRPSQYETLSCSYERQLEDPRIQHGMTLQIDEYGNVLKHLSVSYGRIKSDLQDEQDRKRQERDFVKYTEATYTSAIDDARGFRTPLAVGIRDFRVFNMTWPQAPSIYDIADVSRNNLATLTLAPEIEEENDAPERKGQDDRVVQGIHKIVVAESRVYLKREGLTEPPLPLGSLELNSIPDRTYQLSSTLSMLMRAYNSTDGTIKGMDLTDVLKDNGYQDLDGNNRYWKPSGQSKFSVVGSGPEELQHARSQFYIPTVVIDSLGNKTIHELDEFALMYANQTDSLGNTASISYDYTRLSPSKVVNENGNIQRLVLDGFGSVIGFAQSGKEGEIVGDSLDDFQEVITQDDLETFINNPTGPLTRKLLGKAGIRRIYHPWRFYNSEKNPDGELLPSFEATISRQEHYYPAASEDSGLLVLEIIYADGKGQQIQTANLSKDSVNGAPEVWHISEWIVKDNKGHPIRSHFASLADSPRFNFEPNPESPSFTSLLDPLGREIGRLNPEHTWTKTLTDPWGTQVYSISDTLNIADPTTDFDVGSYFKRLDSQSYMPSWYNTNIAARDRWVAEAAKKSALYATGPRITHNDPIGHPILNLTKSRTGRELKTAFNYDARGNKIGTRDSYDRLVERTLYDFLGRPLQMALMDSGFIWEMKNVLDAVTLHWTDRGVVTRNLYDSLGRQTEIKVKILLGPETLTTRFEYGESLEKNEAMTLNARGKLVQASDQSGISKNVQFDFKGNCLLTSIQFCKEYKAIIDWNSQVDLETEVYETKLGYNAANKQILHVDALGRSTKTILGNDSKLRSVMLQEDATEDWTSIISSVEYNANEQIVEIVRGNKTTTRYTYDYVSRLLLHRATFRSDGVFLEDISHTYDCERRITHRINDAQQTTFVANQQVKPASDYTYDEFGRLIKAQGRQQIASSNGQQRKFIPYTAGYNKSENTIPVSGSHLAEYLETYTYDDADNLINMRHEANSDTSVAGWNREYHYGGSSRLEVGVKGNRITRTQVKDTVDQINYENLPGDGVFSYAGSGGVAGCIASLPGFSSLTWNYQDKLWSSSTQVVREGTPETTWYVYNCAGERVRKVVDSVATQGSQTRKFKEKIYLPHCTVYQKYNGTGNQVKTRIESSEVNTEGIHFGSAEKEMNAAILMRYQISDQLEVDDEGQVISYEEYSPFGSTTYVAKKKDITAPRRYRFASYERDTETGLMFVNARYYAPWLGRWLSPDPMGTTDGLNVYTYVSNDPINWHDTTGTKGSLLNPNGHPIDSSIANLLHSQRAADTRSDAAKIQDLSDKANERDDHHDHHLFQTRWAEYFLAAGINPNEFTLRVAPRIHYLFSHDPTHSHDKEWARLITRLHRKFGKYGNKKTKNLTKAQQLDRKNNTIAAIMASPDIFKRLFSERMEENLKNSGLSYKNLDIKPHGVHREVFSMEMLETMRKRFANDQQKIYSSSSSSSSSSTSSWDSSSDSSSTSSSNSSSTSPPSLFTGNLLSSLPGASLSLFQNASSSPSPVSLPSISKRYLPTSLNSSQTTQGQQFGQSLQLPRIAKNVWTGQRSP